MRSWREAFVDYFDPRVLRILVFGFSSGLPLLLVYSTLSAWLKEEGVTKTAIGLFAWANTAYSFKFLWSPLVDRWRIPLLSGWFGHRRSWMLLSQLTVAVAIFGLGQTQPAVDPWTTALWCVILAVASATQDIVIDAYRVESLDADQMGTGAANNTFGYRMGMLVAGGGCLLIADQVDWHYAYTVMALIMGVGVLATLVSPEPQRRAAPTRGNLIEAIIEPLRDFFLRPGWLLILAFVALYRYSDALLGVMANPFYLELGFTKTEIGLVSKVYGTVMTIVGTFLGGLFYSRMGMMRSLMLAGVAQAASNLFFVALAIKGPSVSLLAVTISVENLAGGLAGAVFVAYLSSLCNVAYTATQYALLSSAAAVARTVFSSGGGWVADHVSWPVFFLITTAAGIPCLILLMVLMQRFPAKDGAPTELVAESD